MPRSCPACRTGEFAGSPGWHWTKPEDPMVEPTRFPCPERAKDDERQRLETIVAEHAKDEQDAAKLAARKVITDAVERFSVPFSLNDLRKEIEAAGLEKRGGLMGAATSWAARHGYIEWTGHMVKSNDPATKGHPLHEWRRTEEYALRYGRRAG